MRNFKYNIAMIGLSFTLILTSGCGRKQKELIEENNYLREQIERLSNGEEEFGFNRDETESILIENKIFSIDQLYFVDYKILYESLGITDVSPSYKIAIVEKGNTLIYDSETMSEVEIDNCKYLSDSVNQISSCRRKTYRLIGNLEDIISLEHHEVMDINNSNSTTSSQHLDIITSSMNISFSDPMIANYKTFECLIRPLESVLSPNDYQKIFTLTELDALQDKINQEDYFQNSNQLIK